MSIFKMAGYALLGYTFYELYQLSSSFNGGQEEEGEQHRPRKQGRGARRRQNAQNRQPQGQTRTEEPGGTSSTHAVGRGVI